MIPTDAVRVEGGQLFAGIPYERARCRVCGRVLNSAHAARGVGPECERRERRVRASERAHVEAHVEAGENRNEGPGPTTQECGGDA